MLGMQQGQQSNLYQQQAAATNSINQPPPRTVASAISRMESLNERLTTASNGLGGIADMLGALRGVPGKDAVGKPAASGAISRLNDSADTAHSQLSDIEVLLAAISSALG